MPIPRLIDLHCDWLLQYAQETTLYDPAHYPWVPGRIAQTEGYLGTTRAAILSCYRAADDWAAQADPWRALAELITRIEAEFSGRLLIDRDDWRRWQDDEPDGLTWGLIGIEGFDCLIREVGDLDRLSGLFERGVRLFQPVYGASSRLGGSAEPGDDRGLTDLGRAFLQVLFDLVPSERGGPSAAGGRGPHEPSRDGRRARLVRGRPGPSGPPGAVV